jgi:hypothetical protein
MVRPTGQPKKTHHKNEPKKVASHSHTKAERAKKTAVKKVPPKRG